MAIRTQIVVCGGTGCMSSHSKEIKEEFERVLKELELDKEVTVFQSGCFGLCEKGPVVIVYPDETFYGHMTVEDVEPLCKEHILKGRIYEKKAYKEATPEEKAKIKLFREMNFYAKQERIALRNCGIINPTDITEYIGRGGYEGLGKVLTEWTPQQVIDEILKSGLRGRGGAGFPTGKKWQFTAVNPGPKYIICNADEGDPGAFMDRAVLEGDPHSIIEAMAIAGYAIGANQGYVYCRAEYPLAVERLNWAIKQAYEYGVLGKNILGSDFAFDLEVR